MLSHVPSATSAASRKKDLGCVELKHSFKGDFIFNVDMYLDFTAKFDILQPHPSPPPSVADIQGSCPFSFRCGAAPTFPPACSLRSKRLSLNPKAPTNLLWGSTVTIVFGQLCQPVRIFPFSAVKTGTHPKMVGVIPECRQSLHRCGRNDCSLSRSGVFDFCQQPSASVPCQLFRCGNPFCSHHHMQCSHLGH